MEPVLLVLMLLGVHPFVWTDRMWIYVILTIVLASVMFGIYVVTARLVQRAKRV